jgi:hypothetical protein
MIARLCFYPVHSLEAQRQLPQWSLKIQGLPLKLISAHVLQTAEANLSPPSEPRRWREKPKKRSSWMVNTRI